MNDNSPQTERPQAAQPDAPVTPPPARPRRWRRVLVQLLLAVVIFLSGGVVGVGGALLAVRYGIIYSIHHPKEMPARIARQLRRRLALSDAQTRQVEQILEQRQAALEQIRRHYQPEVEHELDLIEQQVGAVLNDQQRTRWEQTMRHLRATWIPSLPGEERPTTSDNPTTQAAAP